MKKQPFEIKTAVTDIEEEAALLKSFFNTVQQYQILLNKQFEIVAFNEYAVKFNRKYAQPELEEGKSILDYANSSFAADFRILCNKALNGELIHYEHFINGAHNKKGWFNFTLTSLYGFEGEAIGLMLVGNNINHQKKDAITIHRQSECLSIIAQLQSHEIRQPVSSILGLMYLIKEEDNYKLKKEYLMGLETATRRLDEIIHIIVNQSRKA